MNFNNKPKCFVSSAMVIGFADRETNVYEDGEIHNILVQSDKTSERNHEVRFYLLKASSTATLVSDNETLIDAVFGVKKEDGSVMATKVLTNGTDMFNISTEIIKDTRSEGVECFTLRISTRDTERRSVFRCNKDVTKGYFCYHNVCISDEEIGAYVCACVHACVCDAQAHVCTCNICVVCMFKSHSSFCSYSSATTMPYWV